MIGNDVVDLLLAGNESRVQRRGLLRKLFTEQEQACIEEAEERESMVWVLWSMKEAAYKIVNRSTGRRFYAPLSFSCQLNEYRNGMSEDQAFMSASVVYNETIYPTFTYKKEHFLQTVAINKEGDAGKIRSVSLDQYRSHVREAQISFLLRYTPFDFIKDTRGLPFLKDRETGIRIPVSLSHHGTYICMSWINEN